MGHVQDEAGGFLLHSADDHQGLAEVAQGLARRVEQWLENLFGLMAVLPDVVLADGILAVEILLVPEPLEDAIGRVPPSLRDSVIIVQNLVDDAVEGPQLGTTGQSLPPLARRSDGTE